MVNQSGESTTVVPSGLSVAPAKLATEACGVPASEANTGHESVKVSAEAMPAQAATEIGGFDVDAVPRTNQGSVSTEKLGRAIPRDSRSGFGIEKLGKARKG